METTANRLPQRAVCLLSRPMGAEDAEPVVREEREEESIALQLASRLKTTTAG
jgi:hypothetical protein